MKTMRFFLLTALLAMMAGNATADEFKISDFSIAPGETKTVSIVLDNPTTDYIAFECWLRLPDGVRIVYDEDGYLAAVLNSTRAPRHELEVKEPEGDGVYHLLCYSSRNSVIKEKSGELISLTVKCDADATQGSYDGELYNLVFSDPNKVQVNFPDVSFAITIAGSTMPGDANGDGVVSVADVAEVVNYILQQPSDSFVIGAADMDGNGDVTIADALAIVDIILGRNN